jgi:hypothetical protein
LQRILELAQSTELPLADRKRASRLYASQCYEHDGAIVEVLQEDGQVAAYQPTQEDREARESRLYVKRFSALGGTTMRRARIMWPIVGLVSLLVASFVRVSSESPNSTVPADAARTPRG